MDAIIERFKQPRKTNTEYWLENYPVVEVVMNQPGQFANEGEILVTEGLNGCVALIARIESNDAKIRGFLAHKHLDWKQISRFVQDLDNGGIKTDDLIFATILYPGDKHGISLRKETESIQEELQQELINKFGTNVKQIRAVRYAIYEGFPASVNSNRLAYNVSANMWIYREGARFEHPLSGLLKWEEESKTPPYQSKKLYFSQKFEITAGLAKFLKNIKNK